MLKKFLAVDLLLLNLILFQIVLSAILGEVLPLSVFGIFMFLWAVGTGLVIAVGVDYGRADRTN